MKSIACTPGDLDIIKDEFIEFSHFTVRSGKAKYHMVYLANNSCGLYYAVRVGSKGLEGRRALEPTDQIICWGN